jgi:hypothetical protein
MQPLLLQVIELMRQQASLSSGMSLPEARLALQVLVQQAPEFAAIDNQVCNTVCVGVPASPQCWVQGKV